MSKTVSPEALAALKAANAAASEIKVYAASMLHAQSAELTDEQKDILRNQANALRACLGTAEPQKISVAVFDVHNPNVIHGFNIYTL